MSVERMIPPFTSIVGQEDMKLALILNAIEPRISGVLIRGEKGTAKSTAAQALSQLLPSFETIQGCPFNCMPNQKLALCKACQQHDDVAPVAPFYKKMTVVDLPVSATEDRVVGTLDIQRALKGEGLAVQPGLLAAAHRNILYIDEVNLLDDHVANVLLDAAALGVNVIEREGISLSHPSRFILVGTMNPEEGEPRPQLLDRFGLCVEVKGLNDPAERMEVVRRREAFDRNPDAFAGNYIESQDALRQSITNARDIVDAVDLPERALALIAQTCVRLGVETLRADIVIAKAARALAAFDGRGEVEENDVRKAMELALPHRMRRKPFEKVGSKQELQQTLQETMSGESAPQPEQVFDINPSVRLAELAQGKDRNPERGGRNPQPRPAERGKYVQARPWDGSGDVAVDASLRRAARDASGGPVLVATGHLMKKIRVSKSGMLYVFCLDTSASMGAQTRMELAKGAILQLLQSAYQRRDEVALIAFRGEDAPVVLPPTSNVELAEASLRELPTSGKTPLSQGIQSALQVIEQQRDAHQYARIVLISDGRGNITIKDSLNEDLIWLGEQIRDKGIDLVAINTGKRIQDLGYLKQLTTAAEGNHVYLEEIAQW